MPESIYTEPMGGTAAKVTDFTLYKDSEGHLIRYAARYESFRANDTIAKFAPVAFVPATATVPLSVEVLDISDAFAGLVFAGVAQDAAVAGQLVQICVWGVTLVQVDTGDPIFGDVAIKGASDGTVTTAGTAGGTWDGSDVAGTGFGIFLDVEDAANLAPMFVRPI